MAVLYSHEQPYTEYTGSVYMRSQLVGILAALYLTGLDEHTLRVVAVSLNIAWDEVMDRAKEGG